MAGSRLNPELTNRQFYVYLWLRKNGTPYYVGKGSGDRAYYRFKRGFHPPVSDSMIVIMDRPSEQAAFETEKELISNWGRKDIGTGCLHNRTDGGENPPKRDKPHSEEAKHKMSIAAIGRSNSPETRRKISESLKGRKMSDQAKINIGLAHKGIVFSQERRRKISAALRGRTLSEEHRRNVSKGKIGIKHSAESRLKMSLVRTGMSLCTKGRPWTEARRAAQNKKANG